MMRREVLLAKLSNKEGFEITQELTEAWFFHFQGRDPKEYLDPSVVAKMGAAYQAMWNDAINRFNETGIKQLLPNGAYIYSKRTKTAPLRERWLKMIPDNSSIKFCLDSIGVALGISLTNLIALAEDKDRRRRNMLARSGIYND